MVKLKNINLIQDNKTIFHNFNLTIEDKERLVILGKSGSGKTTILRLIAGLIAPDKGEIIINGQQATKDKYILTQPHKREVNMLFQELALWPHMNVRENIEFALLMQKIEKNKRKKKIEKILNLVSLSGYENRHIDTLSGGEQQRVALARALIVSPKILLMDEPLSSLDPKQNQYLRKKIIQLQEQLGFTLIYVTHNHEEAKEIATRTILLPDLPII